MHEAQHMRRAGSRQAQDLDLHFIGERRGRQRKYPLSNNGIPEPHLVQLHNVATCDAALTVEPDGDPAVTPPFECTVLTSMRPLSKTIQLNADGTLAKGVSHPLSHGRVSRLKITKGMREFADVLHNLDKCRAITTGQLRSDLPDDVEIAAQDKLSDYPNAVTRSRENIVHLSRESGLLLLDFDRKDMPQPVKDRLVALGGFEKAICDVIPEIRQAARLLRPSTSAGIRNIETGKVYPAGGMHLYVVISDVADSERALKVLQDRCWLAGLGWMTISKGGALLTKSIVDTSVWGSERLCYEAAPVLKGSLAQDARISQTHEGLPLDTQTFITDLSPDDMAKVEELKEAERARLKAECAAAQTAHREFLKRRAIERGATIEEAECVVQQAEDRVLLPGFVLTFPDGDVTVDYVLQNPEKFANRYLADPEEGPEYGRTTAILRVNGNDVWVDSLAHGAGPCERRFTLQTSEMLFEQVQDYWLNLPPDHPDWEVVFLGITKTIMDAAQRGAAVEAPVAGSTSMGPTRAAHGFEPSSGAKRAEPNEPFFKPGMPFTTEPEPRAAPSSALNPEPSFFDPWEGVGAPQFPSEVLHPEFEKLIDFVANDLGVERAAVAMVYIAAINAAFHQGARISVKRNGTWEVPPRVWLSLIGDPSTKKTPLLKMAMHVLEKITFEVAGQYAKDCTKWEEDAAAAKAAKQPIPPPPLKRAQLITHDSTVEALVEILSREDRGTNIFRDELSGLIGQMDRYANSKGGDRALFLQGFDGGAYTQNRIKGDRTVENCSFNIIGGIQPEKLKSMLKDLQSDGFMQRMIPVTMGPSSMGTDEPDNGLQAMYEKVIRLVYDLAPDSYDFSDEALKIRDRVLSEIEALKQVDLWGVEFQQWAGKLPIVFMSICLVLHISDAAFDHVVTHASGGLKISSWTPISEGVAARAERIVLDYIVRSAMCFYSSIYGDETARELASFVLTSKKDRFVPSDFKTNVWSLRKQDLWHIEQAVSVLVAGGWLEKAEAGSRKSANPAWTVVPGLRKAFAEKRAACEVRAAKVKELITKYGIIRSVERGAS